MITLFLVVRCLGDGYRPMMTPASAPAPLPSRGCHYSTRHDARARRALRLRSRGARHQAQNPETAVSAVPTSKSSRDVLCKKSLRWNPSSGVPVPGKLRVFRRVLGAKSMVDPVDPIAPCSTNASRAVGGWIEQKTCE